MLIRTVVNGDPSQDHDSISYSTQIRVCWVWSVGLFDISDGHESFVDRLNQILKSSHIRSRHVRFLSLGRDEEKLSLFLESLQYETSLVYDIHQPMSWSSYLLRLTNLLCDKTPNLLANLNIFVHGGIEEDIKLLYRLGEVFFWFLDRGWSSSSRCRGA